MTCEVHTNMLYNNFDEIVSITNGTFQKDLIIINFVIRHISLEPCKGTIDYTHPQKLGLML